jgi:hypothetical protein
LSSDANILKQSHLYKRLERNELNIPKGGPLPQDENGEHMPFVIVGDEAFAVITCLRNVSTLKFKYCQAYIQLQINKSKENGGMRVWHTL